MNSRYRMYPRGNGVFYLEDTVTGKQESLKTKDRNAAKQLLAARNHANENPALNTAIAKVYLLGKSPDLVQRTWANVIADIANNYKDATLERWQRMARSQPFKLIAEIRLVDTEGEHFLRVLRHPEAGTSTNVWLRRLHNYAIDMGWLLTPVLSRKAWPVIHYKRREAITVAEHLRIIASEKNPERRLYYEMLWETGGSQSDIANLSWENVDEEEGILFFYRMKLEGRGSEPARLKIGSKLEKLLQQLPQEGWFFPRIRVEEAKHRSTEFKRRCRIAGVMGKTLHCYRYAWAERAYKAGMPEREAKAHLGHKSSAIHYGYAKGAQIVTLPLEFYEQQKAQKLNEFSTEREVIWNEQLKQPVAA